MPSAYILKLVHCIAQACAASSQADQLCTGAKFEGPSNDAELLRNGLALKGLLYTDPLFGYVQVPQLADMHSSASLIDHSRNLALLDHLQVQHVLEASKLSLQHAMDKVGTQQRTLPALP